MSAPDMLEYECCLFTTMMHCPSSPSLPIHDFDIYLRTTAGQNPNTATKTMKTFKTITILGRKMGVLNHDPFINHRFHLEPVNRGFLTDEEIMKIANKDFGIQRLELVRDVFIFSCFTGLAYIDVSNLISDNVEEYGFDGGIEDVKTLLHSPLMRQLTYLGLGDSEWHYEIGRASCRERV